MPGFLLEGKFQEAIEGYEKASDDAFNWMRIAESYEGLGDIEKALIVVSIAAGSTMLSHVNDSGFWLIGKYLGMDEKQTLQSWTVMESLISVFSFIIVLILTIIFT